MKNLFFILIFISVCFLGFLAWNTFHNGSTQNVAQNIQNQKPVGALTPAEQKQAVVASAANLDTSGFSALAGEVSIQSLPPELQGYVFIEAEAVSVKDISNAANGQTGFLVEYTIRQDWDYNQIQNKFMSLSGAAMTSARWLEESGIVEFSLEKYSVKIAWNKDGPKLYSVKMFAIKKI
jgi:hypothetical protein